jgi:hypothetical protein
MSFIPFRCAWPLAMVLSCAPAFAANQTNTFTPVHVGNSFPYAIDVKAYDFGAAALPTLQSFATGTYDGKWIMLAGRTNGIHGFGQTGQQNFPPAYQKKEVWVVDPVTKQSWHHSLASDATLSALQVAELSSTNTEFTQIGDRLYVAGGYGLSPASSFQTFNHLTAIDLPSLTDWVINGAGSASGSMRRITDPAFQVTGGAMHSMNGRTHLIMGQNFTGGYPGGTGVYTRQVRSFDIVDDGTTLSIANLTSTPIDENYRRRDLNVVPTVDTQNGQIVKGWEALAGVFTSTNGVWTVPVKINSAGQPSMADPNAPDTFKQGMNVYHSAKLGLYSAQADQMHTVLFGGLTLEYFDDATQSFVRDDNVPFTSQISQVNVDANGNYTQDYIGSFPAITDQTGKLMRFGAGAEFFPADAVPMYDNGVINLDALSAPTTLGYIFGGIFSNAPNTQGVPDAVSGGSNQIFEVVYRPVPEPGCFAILIMPMLALARRRDGADRAQRFDQLTIN